MIEAALIIDWDGEIIFANNSAAKLVHLEDASQGIGKNVFEFLHDDFAPQVYSALKYLERTLPCSKMNILSKQLKMKNCG